MFDTAIYSGISTQGLKATSSRQRSVEMRRLLLFFVFLGLLMPNFHHQLLMEEEYPSYTGTSDISIEISNGPTAGESITGSNSLTFATAGTGTLVNLTIEISSDNSDWDELTTLGLRLE